MMRGRSVQIRRNCQNVGKMAEMVREMGVVYRQKGCRWVLLQIGFAVRVSNSLGKG
jgi:hypothetical protein